MKKPIGLFLHIKSSIYNIKGKQLFKYLEKELKEVSNFENITISPILINSSTTLNERTTQFNNQIEKLYSNYKTKLSIITYSFASLPVQEGISMNKSIQSKVDQVLYVSSPIYSSKFCETLNTTSPCFLYHQIADGCQVELTWLKEEYNKKALQSVSSSDEYKKGFKNIHQSYLSAKAFVPPFPLSYTQSKIYSHSEQRYNPSDGVISENDMSNNGEKDVISIPSDHFELFGLSSTINNKVFSFYGKYFK